MLLDRFVESGIACLLYLLLLDISDREGDAEEAGGFSGAGVISTRRLADRAHQTTS